MSTDDRTPGRCQWCDYSDEACRAARSAGYIKCCPDCDHRPEESP